MIGSADGGRIEGPPVTLDLACGYTLSANELAQMGMSDHMLTLLERLQAEAQGPASDGGEIALE